LHSQAKTQASFDDPNLVSQAGLVPVMALAERAGLAALVAEHVRPGGECGVNADLKVPCLVAGMAAGADSIDDMVWVPKTCVNWADALHIAVGSAPRSGSGQALVCLEVR
jgi:hypothetical protein